MSTLAASVSPFASATAHARAIRERAISSADLTDLYLQRIDAHNPRLHAIVISNAADARRAARERDEELAHGIVRGPLHGVPVTVKEAFDVAGLPTTINLSPLRRNIPTADALIVQHLKAAGAIVLGKTNVPAMLADYQCFGPIYPAANNPFDSARTPGGSTGGGAAAVAAGLTTFEIGSDLAGSIRVPAHFCGVFGLKPTENCTTHGRGHVPPPPKSRGGYLAMACIGPLARTMADIELAWRVITPPTWNFVHHLPAKPRTKTTLDAYRVAWFDDVGRVACGDDTKALLAAFLRRLEAAGVVTHERPFERRWLDEAYAVWGLLFGAMVGQHVPWIVRQVMKYQFGRTARGSAIDVLTPWKTGLDLRFADFSRALARRVALIEDFGRRFDECDFIVSPVAAGPAFAHNRGHRPIALDGRSVPYLDYAMPSTIAYNACGNPVLVVPAGLSADGLPIGLQIAAPHYAEADLIHFGTLIERLGVTCATPPGFPP